MHSPQLTQNKALTFAYSKKYPYTMTTKEMHINAKLSPIHITLYNRGNRAKEKMINELNDEHYCTLITANNEEPNNHQWFRRPHLKVYMTPKSMFVSYNKTIFILLNDKGHLAVRSCNLLESATF